MPIRCETRTKIAFTLMGGAFVIAFALFVWAMIFNPILGWATPFMVVPFGIGLGLLPHQEDWTRQRREDKEDRTELARLLGEDVPVDNVLPSNIEFGSRYMQCKYYQCTDEPQPPLFVLCEKHKDHAITVYV